MPNVTRFVEGLPDRQGGSASLPELSLACAEERQKVFGTFGSGLQYCNSRINWFLETTVVELPLLDRQMGHRFGGSRGVV